MKKPILLLWLCVFTVTPSIAFAATPDASIVDTVNKAISLAASTSILPQALTWLGSFMALQFVITNFGLLKNGSDIEAVFGKLIGSLAWFSFCVYLLNNGPDFIDTVGHAMLTKFAPNIPTPGSIIASTTALCSSILFAIVVTGTSIVGTGNSAVANVLVIVCITIFSIGLYMAIKIMMLSLELGLIVMLAPLSFSFLGLSALKDQGIAPFKSLISLTYRIIILGVLCTALGEVMKVSGDQLTAIDWTKPAQWGPGLNILISSIVAFPVIGYLIYKSDSIASSLASGSTDMGPGDVAKAAAAGAAAGAAVASGGSSLAGVATKAPQGMGDVIKQMMGGGVSVSNASDRGFGGQTPIGEAPQRAPSLSAGNSTGGRFPQRSTSTSADSGIGGASAPISGNTAAVSKQDTSAVNMDTAPRRSTSNTGNSSPVANASGDNSAGSAAQPTSSTQANSSAQSRNSDDQAPAKSAVPNERPTPSDQPTNAPTSTKSVESAPVRPTQPDNLRAPVRPRDGSAAGITGGPSTSPDTQNQKARPALGEKLSKFNEHLAQEKAATHIAINTHHQD